MVTDYKRKIKDIIKHKRFKGKDMTNIFVLDLLEQFQCTITNKQKTLTMNDLRYLFLTLNEYEREIAGEGCNLYNLLPPLRNYCAIYFKDFELHFAIQVMNLNHFLDFETLVAKLQNKYPSESNVDLYNELNNFENSESQIFSYTENAFNKADSHTIEEDIAVIKAYNSFMDCLSFYFQFDFAVAKFDLCQLIEQIKLYNLRIDKLLSDYEDDELKEEITKRFQKIDIDNIYNVREEASEEVKQLLNRPITAMDSKERFQDLFFYFDKLCGVETK